MKTTYLLTALLIGSLGFNYYQYTSTKADVTLCEVTPPYADAIEISPDDAKKYYMEFNNSLVSPDNTTGGAISRAAFDAMLCMKDCNGITYSFARDKSGTTGPANNGVFIVFQGANIQFEAATNSYTVNPIPGAKIYRPGNWCPPVCMLW